MNFVWEIARLDFGHSFRGGSTIDAIGERAFNTFKLGVAGLVFALALGIPLGIVAALRRASPLDWVARTLAVIGQATPNFWLGLMLIFFFAVRLDWFPTGGAEGFKALILPAISLGLLEAAAFMRLTRSGMIEVMDTDFIRTARAKGLPERTVIGRHAIRHALLPVVTIMGIGLGRMIAGSVIVEVVFAWPGVGRLIIDSIIQSDYPMVQASIIVLAASISLANLLVDVSYRFIDPRIRAESVVMAHRAAPAAEVPLVLQPVRRRRRWRRHAGLSLPAVVALVFLLSGALAGLHPDDPNFIDVVNRLQRPVFDGGSWSHPLGTDELGRDMLSRLMAGAQVSLIVVAIVVPGAALVGTAIGMVSGWLGGVWGQILMRVVDVQLALPAILFAVLLGTVFGPSLRNVIIILLIWTWSSYARLVRADVLSLRERDFVTASPRHRGRRLVDHAQAPAPQPRQHDRDRDDAGDRDRDPGGGGPELPGRGRGSGHLVVGPHDHRRPHLHEPSLVGDLAARARPAADLADGQPDGRLAPRRPRSAAAQRALASAPGSSGLVEGF